MKLPRRAPLSERVADRLFRALSREVRGWPFNSSGNRFQVTSFSADDARIQVTLERASAVEQCARRPFG